MTSTQQWFEWLLHPSKFKRARMFLGGISRADQVDIDTVGRMLETEETTFVFWALEVLGRLGRIGVEGASLQGKVAALAKTHPTVRVREAAISALTKMAPGSEVLRSVLLDRVDDPDETVRGAVVRGLFDVELHKEDSAQIAKLTADPSEYVASGAAELLQRISSRSP
jgi:HEAT repeat protein